MKLKAPNAFVLIFSILLVAMALTWVIPGGEYDREEVIVPGVGKEEVVVRGSFKQVDSVPQTPFDAIKAPQKAIAKKAASVVGFILLIGGAFGVLTATGALMAGLRALTKYAQGAGRFIMIPVLMFMFSTGGVLFGMAEETLVFVLLTVPLAVALRFDTLTGIAIPFIGSQAGFATAFVNPFSFGIAKNLAQRPVGDGVGFRIACWLIITTVCIAFVMWHAWRVYKDPSRSPTPKLDEKWRKEFESQTGGGDGFSLRQKLVVIIFLLSMGLLGFGSIKLGWYTTEIAGVFIGIAIVCGAIGGLAPGKIADSFMQGAKDLCATAVLVGFAQGILILCQDGKILDTMLNAAATALEGQSPVVCTELMYAVQTGINFFIPSGSGQAALTMPVMAPLADAVNVHRENAILAYQFGDGFTNMIIPTNPVCVGVIGAVGVGYGTWFRWMWSRQVVLFLLGAILLYFSPFSVAAN